ncbi:amidohydrolase [Halobacillus shinanisalinarum]|uniref:Amidohydrolase n=1 Tax=Halobacillus shinanisalinarum TaxID=2932258 RepID=A0ABY4GW86_9BACI|nr:amidohydrolase [Halobacillus shinanisalinarum]UOQ92304.1 amidohydrolase [Halobacillus shinanisalinarum]
MKEADSILVDGNVITMDEELPSANSIVVKDGTILFVGDKEEALSWLGSNTEVINLKGKTMLPGFVESHLHPAHYALNLLELDCRPKHTSSIETILEKVRMAAESAQDGQWIRGWGWDDSKLTERRNPLRWELDKAAPNHPVILKRTCGHMAVVNSKALELSGISEDTKDPKGGKLEREIGTGALTGLLQEKAQGMAALPDYSFDDMVKGMKLAQKDFAKWGITTVHDMSTQTAELQVYQYLLEQNELNVRIRPWIWAVDQNGWTGLLNEVLSVGIRSGFGNDMIKIQGMKFMLDGSIGGRTAAVAEPYEDDDQTGILYNTVEEVSPFIKQSLAAGLRVAIHGIGERAIEVAIKSLEEASESIDISHLRNRIEHCALPTNDHLRRMKKLELMAASSVGFLYHIGDSYIKNLGTERMKRVYPHKSFKEYGIVAPGNSDLPVTDGNPWTGIYGAVTRKSLSGQVLDDTQNIEVQDALKAYTVDAAYSSFEEQSIGVIKPLAKADLIVVSDDPLTIENEKLKDIKVERTFIGGRLVYSESRKDEAYV